MALIFHLLFIKKIISHLTLNLCFGMAKNDLLICASAIGVTVGLNGGMSNGINISLVIHSKNSHLTLNLRFGVVKKGFIDMRYDNWRNRRPK